MESRLKRIVMQLVVGAILPFAISNAVAAPTQEQQYPSKPVTVVVTYPAGGGADVEARIIAQAFERELGVPFQVVNRPGGAFIPGITSVLSEPADGYTIVHVAAANLLSTPYTIGAPYSYRDLTPLFFANKIQLTIYARADGEFETLADLVEASRTRKLIVGINAIGAPPHLSMAQFAQSIGLDVEYLVAETVPASLVGLIGGHCDVAIGAAGHLALYPDEIRALAILDRSGSDLLPGVPTVSEALPGTGAEAVTWHRSGFAVKAGTPQAVLDVLSATADEVMQMPSTIEALTNAAFECDYVGIDDAQELMEEGATFYESMIDALDLREGQ